jgi:hypothetical protein
MRLCSIASIHWDQIIGHYHAMPRSNPLVHPLLLVSPAEFVGLVYAWAIERVPPDKVDDWEAELVDLLPWQDSSSAAAEELESASFMASMKATGAGVAL